MTPDNNSPEADFASPTEPPLFGQPVLSETAEVALKAVIAIRAQEATTLWKNNQFYSPGGIND